MKSETDVKIAMVVLSATVFARSPSYTIYATSRALAFQYVLDAILQTIFWLMSSRWNRSTYVVGFFKFLQINYMPSTLKHHIKNTNSHN